MVLRLIVVAIILGSVLVACSDRFRDPCGYVRSAATTTVVRTKNKALGWVPSSTIAYGFSTGPAAGGVGGSKCG
jgi:hypothetical protein